jgi:hypothetical protein
MQDIILDIIVPIITAALAYFGAVSKSKAQLKIAKENNESEIKKLKIQHEQEMEKLKAEIESRKEVDQQQFGMDIIKEIFSDPVVKRQIVSEANKQSKKQKIK